MAPPSLWSWVSRASGIVEGSVDVSFVSCPKSKHQSYKQISYRISVKMKGRVVRFQGSPDHPPPHSFPSNPLGPIPLGDGAGGGGSDNSLLGLLPILWLALLGETRYVNLVRGIFALIPIQTVDEPARRSFYGSFGKFSGHHRIEGGGCFLEQYPHPPPPPIPEP